MVGLKCIMNIETACACVSVCARGGGCMAVLQLCAALATYIDIDLFGVWAAHSDLRLGVDVANVTKPAMVHGSFNCKCISN